MSILFRYLARELLSGIALAALALLLVFTFFDLVNEVTDAGGGYTKTLALAYVFLNSPARLYELAPLAVVIGALFKWNRLVLASEFTVLRAGGLSTARLALWMSVLGLGIGLAMLALGEYVSPHAGRLAQQLKIRATTGVVAKEFQTGLWAKDGRTFINIREMRPDATLSDLRMYRFDEAFHLTSMLRANQARWDGERWRLEGVTETVLTPQATRTRQAPDQVWSSAVTPDLLLLLMVKPENMSIQALSGYVGHLLENRQDARRYSIALWNKLLYPLAMPVMLLMALAFAFRPPRTSETGGRLLTGVLLGLGFYLASRMLSQMTLLQSWSAWVSALTPIALFGAASLAMLWRADRV